MEESGSQREAWVVVSDPGKVKENEKKRVVDVSAFGIYEHLPKNFQARKTKFILLPKMETSAILLLFCRKDSLKITV